MSLCELRSEWEDCQRCSLSETRTQLVFGEGNPEADILFVGEAPGEEEDASGVPYVGPAGGMFNDMIESVGLNRDEDMFVTNVLCCRPTQESKDDRTGGTKIENRSPNKEERESCRPRLLETVYQVDPLIIVASGNVAIQALLSKAPKISAIQGHFQTMHLEGRHRMVRYPLMPLFHPSYLLRSHDRRPEGPWGQTMDNWLKVCNVLDYLRSAYFGIDKPDREKIAHEQARKHRSG